MADDSTPDWGAGGQVNRSAIATELMQKPWLHDRLKQMIRGEVGAKASPETRRIQMESAMNRALVRDHSLEQALWDTGEHGQKGYYPAKSFNRGGYNHDDYLGDLQAVLSGSNYGGKYLPQGHLVTGNASEGVAQRQFAKNTPGFTLQTGSGPESYFNEDAKRRERMVGLLGPTEGGNFTQYAAPRTAIDRSALNPNIWAGAGVGQLKGNSTDATGPRPGMTDAAVAAMLDTPWGQQPTYGGGVPSRVTTSMSPPGAPFQAPQVNASNAATAIGDAFKGNAGNANAMALAQQLIKMYQQPQQMQPIQFADPSIANPRHPLPLNIPTFGRSPTLAG